jgi:hypothetical protein
LTQVIVSVNSSPVLGEVVEDRRGCADCELEICSNVFVELPPQLCCSFLFDYRDAVIEEMENGDGNYQTMVYYMDIMNTYERMGDFMINISQDLERGFVNK